jgi:Ethanolamine utilization protein EutJ (predicted chaperonin)
MLSIWLDFGTSVSEMEKDKERTREKLEIMNDMKTNLDKMTRIIGKHVKFHTKHIFCNVKFYRQKM